MYVDYFGFRERPFQLVPNPSYLYLSRSHEEALAHLTYAISNGDGFVEITGEVGTGKTTLCRVFLESLDENTEAAYIFNPKLDSVQLLKAINDEYNISSLTDNSKELIDTLNAFLINKKAAGKTVILLIDEAQNLSKEVLEQLRLLSNLETSTSKLLQIILVGQPELGEMLDSHELRQLGQRITLSWRLSPLSFNESIGYIEHRIQVAAPKAPVRFEPAACRIIYKYSKGVPRLINIVCDRALLTAFGQETRTIGYRIARESVKELTDRQDGRPYLFREINYGIIYLAVACLVLFAVFLFFPGGLTSSDPPPARTEYSQALPAPVVHDQVKEKAPAAPASLPAAPATIETAAEPKINAAPVAPEPTAAQKTTALQPPGKTPEKPAGSGSQTTDIRTLLRSVEPPQSRQMALINVLRQWNANAVINSHLDDIDNDLDFYRLSLKQNGFLLHCIDGGDLQLLASLNLPAILVFRLPDEQSARHLALTGIKNKAFTLMGGRRNDVAAADLNELNTFWTGLAYIPWKNHYSYEGTIPRNADKDSILIFKMLMRDIGFADIRISPVYDAQAREMVKKIQARNGIEADGVVGPATKIVLYNEIDSLQIPRLADKSTR